MMNDMTNATGHAFHAGNFKMLSATISHSIGANPSMNNNLLNPFYRN